MSLIVLVICLTPFHSASTKPRDGKKQYPLKLCVRFLEYNGYTYNDSPLFHIPTISSFYLNTIAEENEL